MKNHNILGEKYNMGMIIILFSFGSIFAGLIAGSLIISAYTKEKNIDQSDERPTLKYRMLSTIIARVVVGIVFIMIFNLFFSSIFGTFIDQVMQGNLSLITLLPLFFMGIVIAIGYQIVYYFIEGMFYEKK